MYKVSFSRKAKKQFLKLDRYTRIMIEHWIIKNIQNCEDPFQHGKELKGDLKGIWRYRVGDYRLLAEIHEDELVILVINVGHRRDIYDRK